MADGTAIAIYSCYDCGKDATKWVSVDYWVSPITAESSDDHITGQLWAAFLLDHKTRSCTRINSCRKLYKA